MFSRIFAPVQRKQYTPLALGLVSMMVFLVGCSLTGNAPVNTTNTNGIVLSSGANATPPPFPPFTIGAWVSNQTPQKGDKDHLYVLARIQPADMQSPASPAVNQGVTAVIDGVSQSLPTDSDGFAKFDFDANASPTKPSVINVYATYQNVQYATTTFYTVLPEITVTPSPSGTVTPTPTKGP